MLIPAWHIGVTLLLLAGLHLYRARRDARRRYSSIGRAGAWLLLSGTYFYIEAATPTPAEAQLLFRWSLAAATLTLILFLAQELVQEYKVKR